MNPRWDESEFLFCDLQAAARYIRRDNPAAALNMSRKSKPSLYSFGVVIPPFVTYPRVA
jgi:hypothetical protein